jgi:hypothetical protein
MSTDQLTKVAKKYTIKLLLKQAEEENDFYWDQKDKFRLIYNSLEEDLRALNARKLNGNRPFKEINELRINLMEFWKQVDQDYPDDNLRNIVSWVRGNHQSLAKLQETLTHLLDSTFSSRYDVPRYKPVGIPLLLEWIKELHAHFAKQFGSNKPQMESVTLKPPAQMSEPVESIQFPQAPLLPKIY